LQKSQKNRDQERDKAVSIPASSNMKQYVGY